LVGKTGAKTLTPQDRRLLPGGFKQHGIAALIIAITVMAAYGASLPAPFLYDDQRNITENHYVRMTRLSLSQIKRAMVQDKFQLRPLANLTFAFDHYFHGLNRKTMRTENMALHFMAAFGLYLLVLALARQFGDNDDGPAPAFVAALLASLAWALHPAQTQAVTYIVQRQTVMATGFSVFAFLFYVLARDTEDARRRRRLVAAAVVFFVVAAGSKEISAAAPVLCLFYEVLLLRRGDRRASGKAAFTVGAIVAVMAVLALTALFSTGLWSVYMGGYSELGYSAWQRVLTETRIIAGYLGTLAFPHPVRMALDHSPGLSTSLIDPITTLPALLFVAGTFLSGVRLLYRGRFAGLLFLGFLLSLAPESSFIPLELKYDHRMYMPSLFVVPPLVFRIVKAVGIKRAAPVMAVTLLLMASLTYSRNLTYRSKIEIWKDSAGKSPHKVRPWSNLCGALLENNRPHAALKACERALRLRPNIADPYLNKAVALYRLSREKEAIGLLAETVTAFPESAAAHYNYGRYLEMPAEDPQAAVSEYERALELDPYLLDARLALGVLLKKEGRTERALSELNLLVKDYPDCQRCWAWYGLAACDADYVDGAARALHHARRLGPDTGLIRRLETAIGSCRSGP